MSAQQLINRVKTSILSMHSKATNLTIFDFSLAGCLNENIL